MRSIARYALILLLSMALAWVPGTAHAAGTITGTVTQLGGGPIEDATITIAAPDQPPVTATTDATGFYTRDVDGSGPFSVGVRADGFRSQAVAGKSAGGVVDFTLDVSTLTTLPAYAGAGHEVVADATSGTFYLLVNPEVYRTIDYGGTWQPVTMAYDDPDHGLRNSNNIAAMSVSSVSGEVAVAAQLSFMTADVSFSTDYGVTWRRVGGDFQPVHWNPWSAPLQLFWAHANSDPGTEDVLLAAQAVDGGGWDVWVADMSAANPAFVKLPTDTFPDGAVVDVADSNTGSFVGQVNSAGTLRFAPLTASGPGTWTDMSGLTLPTPPKSLHLGGAKETSAPPDAALEVGGTGPNTAQMITKTGDSFEGGSFSDPTVLPNCHPGGPLPQTPSAVAPTSGGTTGVGVVLGCWVQKDGTSLSVDDSVSVGSLAFDASWGNGNLVAITGSCGGEPWKFADLDSNGLPVHKQAPAQPGTAADSGGYSFEGITDLVVNDTDWGPTYEPTGVKELAVAAVHATLASKDGGKTMVPLLPRWTIDEFWGNAAQWWQGANDGTDHDWLLFGHMNAGCGNMLTAFRDWNGTDTLPEPNVSGSACADLGGPPPGDPGFWETGAYEVTALAPVPNDDVVFIATATQGENLFGTGHHLYRARLVPGTPPSLTDVVSLGTPPYEPKAMAYCPATSASAAMQDVLFVATGTDSPSNPGSLLRITDASGPSPTTHVVASIPSGESSTELNDVRADCDAGVVYAGGWNPAGGSGFYASHDGGMTFELENTLGIPFITAIGLNPVDPNDVKIATSSDGEILHSSDGGASWTVVYDPSILRAEGVNDIEYLPAGSGGPRSMTSSVSGSGPRAVVSTSSGAFEGDLDASSGITAVAKRPGAIWLGSAITSLGSDSHPALAVVPATGRALAVIHRANGLSFSSATPSGSWSIPETVPGTKGSDDHPVVVRDAAGRLDLAFVRTGAGAGIYVSIRRTSGTWTAPYRVSAMAGDALPSIAATGSSPPHLHVAFLRPGGSHPGVYYTSNSSGSWSTPRRIPGTFEEDAQPRFGGPALAPRHDEITVAFSRAFDGPGIYEASRGASGWSRPHRLTNVAGDRDPSLVVDAVGVPSLVFRRPAGTAHGIYLIRGAGGPAHVPGTLAADAAPDLTVRGTTLLLTFARTAGRPGIYYDRWSGRSWLRAPQRRTQSGLDRNPVMGTDRTGLVTILFERA